ncbi:CDP-glycerol glycerophosphotransferase family protein [Colwelliaceae bacterium 6471]
MKVYFDIQHLYYVPQYLPLKKELESRNIQCEFVLYKQKLLNDVLKLYVEQNLLNCRWVANKHEAREVYLEDKPEWIIFGNAFDDLTTINKHSKTALMQHGIGPKSCYYDVSKSDITYRFVEGQHRLKRLQSQFPNKKFIDTGYAKLDPIVNQSFDNTTLLNLNLCPNKKTILYAPTFYPSSIECLPKNFPELLHNYNIIIKPHFFSWIKRRHKSHQALFNTWANYENVYVANVNQVSILPFMSLAQLLISDASSTLFEFTALNKPAIWCDFYKLRWSYRGIFKKRLANRLDDDLKYFAKIAQRVTSWGMLIEQIAVQLEQPDLKEKERLEMTELLTGKVDGNCSQRIANFIINGAL